MIFPLMLFRIVLALSAWTAILYDNYRHRDLKLVAFAFTFLVLGTITSYFSNLFQALGDKNFQFFLIITHIFAVLFSGLLFALTAYAAHQSMKRIEDKTKKLMRKP